MRKSIDENHQKMKHKKKESDNQVIETIYQHFEEMSVSIH
jgi:hypothetical protein